MAGNDLYIGIGADVSGLETGLNKAGKDLKEFGNDAKKAKKPLENMAKTTKANATPALQEFSRVVQDAPYGIQGVANNIQQLTSQFGYLSQKTGGTKKALSAMIGGLVGPAGILFAVSAVTSLLVSYGDEIGEFIFGTDEGTKSIDAMNTSLEKQLELRGKLNKAFSDATKLALLEAKVAGKSADEQAEIVKNTLNAKVDALEIQKKALVASLIDQGNLIAQASGDEKDKLKEIQEKSSDQLKELNKDLEDTRIELKVNSLKEEIRLNDLSLKDTRETEKERERILKESQTRTKATSIQGNSGDDILINTKATKKAFGEITKELGGFAGFTAITSEQIMASMGNMFDPDAILAQRDALGEQFQAISDMATDFNNDMANIIGGSIASTFSELGTVIGEALASGENVFNAIGQSLLNSLGNFLSEMGEMLIYYGTLAIAKGVLDEAISKGGKVAIIAGVAAIGVGIALKAISGAMGAKAAGGLGGSSSSSGVSSVSSSPSTSSASTTSSSSGGTYVFEIQGTKLIGVMKNTLNRNRALGGATNLTFS